MRVLRPILFSPLRFGHYAMLGERRLANASHAVRASFLANAATTTFLCARANKLLAQWVS